MPRVGNRTFPYTRAGQQRARRYAKATGQPVRSSGGRAPYPVRPSGRRNAIRRPGPGIAPPRGGMRGRPSRPSGPSRRGGSRVMRNPGMAPKPKRNY